MNKSVEKCSEVILNSERKNAYCFTSFEVNPPDFVEKYMKYLCYSPEICPSTGKSHWQGYLYLKGRGMTISALQKKGYTYGKLLCANGTADENRTYCGANDYNKDGKFKEKNPLFKEFGELPSQGKRNDLFCLKEDLMNGNTTLEEVILTDPVKYHQYGRTLEKIEEILLRKQIRTEMPNVYWYWGDTGVGKSHKAFENYNPDTDYILNYKDNGFWEGYTNQKKVIINEFRGEIPFSELLQICDKWTYMVKRKGKGPIPLMATEIIITSCSSPREIYNKSLSKRDSIEQFYRRCNVLRLEKSLV